MKKRILITALVFLITGVVYAIYLYTKPRQSVMHEVPAYVLDAAALADSYETDERLANEKFLGKIVEVRGVVIERLMDEKAGYSITLKGKDLAGVGCNFESKESMMEAGLQEGQEVIVKGICTGALMDVVLVDCVIVERINN